MHFFTPKYAITFTIILFLSLGALSVSGEEEPLSFNLRVGVSRCDDKVVQTQNWVDSHIKAAKEIFAEHGIEINVTIDEFVPNRCELTNRPHRHSYAEFVAPREVNVLVAKRIQDLDVPSYNLMGVHWRYRGNSELFKGRRWVFLTSRAKPPVLAHELCHFFGLRHDTKGGNLMTPGPSDPSQMGDGPKPKPFKPILTKEQATKLIEGIRLWNSSLK